MVAYQQVRVLTLNDGEHQDSTLYRVQKTCVLQFRLGASLLGKRVIVYCNHPNGEYPYEQVNANGEPEFVRNQYFALEWRVDDNTKCSDETANYCEIELTRAGSFHYYFIYEHADNKGPQGSGFFIVDPEIRVGTGLSERLPLDCVQCQTVIAKQLGALSTWEAKLRVTIESGYNCVHFTPIQALGASNSAYSLRDQMRLNPLFNEGAQEVTFNDVEYVIGKLRCEYKVISICDIVLNHTANETEWLYEHPESTYNCLNSPHLRPACLLDAALFKLTLDVQSGALESRGVPRVITNEEQLNALRHIFHRDYLTLINVHEMFICHVTNTVADFVDICRNRLPSVTPAIETRDDLKLIQDPNYQRFQSIVDLDLAARLFNVYRQDVYDEEGRIKRCADDFKAFLEQINRNKTDEIASHLSQAIDNCIAGIRYERLQADGPKIKDISPKNPLVPRYFTSHGPPLEHTRSLAELERVMYEPEGRFFMAHNGWVMDADPLRNFAAADSNVYLRRELIAWGDSVKLRYGETPDDCPFLWNYMRSYVEQTASIFDGVRLDNCHSTPLVVAEYMLDAARRINPDLYVVAELFTSSDQKDNIFVNRLGISSLIREASSAWDSHEQGRLVYRFGGVPVGAFRQPRVQPLTPGIAHAMFMDLTHDNPSAVEKRSVFDLLPTAAMVNMACCASGSNRGYDELVPHHIHVVNETREYAEWADNESLATGNAQFVGAGSGIIRAKKSLNNLHYRLGYEGYNQVFVDQMDADVVAVTRHCPETHQSVIAVAFTAFSHPPEHASFEQRHIRPLRVEGVVEEVVLEASLSHISARTGGSRYARGKPFLRDPHYINGLTEYECDVREHLNLNNSTMLERVDSGESNITQMKFKNFKPGCVVVIRVSLPTNVRPALGNLRKLLVEMDATDLRRVIGKLTFADLNRALFRCDGEERDDGKGFGAYDIPGHGPLVYCGMQGFMSVLARIRPINDLGHPLCNNLRDGNWMMEYIVNRLKVSDGTRELAQWLDAAFDNLKKIPRYLIPSYFDVLVTGVYVALLDQCYRSMSDFVQEGSTFVRTLALASIQCAGVVPSASLPPLSPHILPPTNRDDKQLPNVTLSAGLPHFAIGYMRSWGRDTFIALRGTFILTGRFDEARYHILGYAACLRHGLIPNLLDGGRNSRYNCRDAVWWWLYSIQAYVKEAPNGSLILAEPVSRIFPQDDSPPFESGQADQPLHDVIQEALTKHFQGLAFRERNAGRQIDAHMSDRGFNNQIGVNADTGFVYGGNASNCGTWMDKMGSSERAGNRGKPSTPRDGVAVEIVGLCYSALVWLHELYGRGEFPHGSVQRKHRDGSQTTWTYKQWADKIAANFERYFWVNEQPSSGEPRPDLVHRRGIYKDTYGASQAWSDYQLRCNFPIAMVVAPELFDAQHAWLALKNAQDILLGPLGMKTLDPNDWAYNGVYDNANDSDDAKIAHGFNYHQGPEWVWPVAWFLRARLLFSHENGEYLKTIYSTRAILAAHLAELQTSPWRGLPELTNENGTYCAGSCRTQAWSNACVLEVLKDLRDYETKQPVAVVEENY